MIKELGNNRARLIVSIGSGDTRRRATKTITYKTKKELRQAYEDFEREARNGPPSDMTVGELIKAHIEHSEAIGRKAETIRGYRVCEKRLNLPFKRILAKDCTSYHVEREVARMAKNGLSAKTIKNTVGLISAAYRHAMRQKLLKENPCDGVVLPTIKKADVRILYREEIQPFLNALADAPLDDKVAYELALFLGLRRSEILGLKEQDVDLDGGMVYVHNTRHRVDGKDYDSDTKTEKSKRVLALPDILITDIKALMRLHENLRYEHTDYLIQDGFGGTYSPQALSQRLVKLQRAHGLPEVSLHKLRHTYASLLNESGVDMARISRELGHSNLATTMNIYTHIFKTPTQSSRGIAEVINSLELPAE